MSGPSPVCLVNGNPTPQDVAGLSSFTIALASVAGANFWSIQCTSTDDTSSSATVDASLSVNQTTKTATCTSTATGSAMIFTSIVGIRGLGLDDNGVFQPSFIGTFGVNVPLGGGARVLAANESAEQSAVFGWITKINQAIRAANGGTFGGSPVPIGVVTALVSESSSISIPAGSWVYRVTTNIGTVYPTGTLSVGLSSNPTLLQSTSDIDAQATGPNTTESIVIWPSTSPVLVTVGGSPVSGAAKTLVAYATPAF
jgi:hypothetical protein